jgi:hypothetical protein
MGTEWNVDYVKRDGKRFPMDSIPLAFVCFVVFVFVVIPIVIAVYVLAKIYQVLTQLGIIPKRKNELNSTYQLSTPLVVKKKSSDQNGRLYDLVMFGATGFTGNLAANYLAKQYGNPGTKVRWAISGRSLSKLEEAKKSIMKQFPEVSDVALLVADSNNDEQLQKLAQQTKVIITTVGPFTEYGEGLVRACVENGTHYCDITAEANWVRHIIERYQRTAEASGAKIVHFCGHDCVPWDISVMKVARTLQKRGEEMFDVSERKCFCFTLVLFILILMRILFFL